jgi:hypothetical protein
VLAAGGGAFVDEETRQRIKHETPSTQHRQPCNAGAAVARARADLCPGRSRHRIR